MFETFKLTNWALVRENCDIDYRINTTEEVDILLGDQSASFELCLDAASLRKLVNQGNQALQEMHRLAEKEAEDEKEEEKKAAERAAAVESGMSPVDESA